MKKGPKKLIIILSVVAVLLVGGLTAGYITVNKMFSIFSDSFYQVPEPVASEEPVAEESPGPAINEEEEKPKETPPAKTPSAPSLENLPSVTLSKEESRQMISAISFADKVAVMKILSAGLSPPEYKEVMGMISGGITAEEVKRARHILSHSLSDGDKEKILSYYAKYAYLLE